MKNSLLHFSRLLTVSLGLVVAFPGAAANRGPPAGQPQAKPASALIGAEIVDRDGVRFGEVRDLVIDAARGRVQYVVVAPARDLAPGGKLLALPLDRLRLQRSGAIVLGVTRDKLEDSPGIDLQRWPPDFAKVDRYYGRQASPTPRYVRASEMLKGDVKDRDRNDIGDIEDVVIDPATGTPRYVVVEFDRAWQSDGRLVAMPMRILKEEADGTDLVYAASPRELRSAPAFGRDEWPIGGDPTLAEELDRYERSSRATPAGATEAEPGR